MTASLDGVGCRIGSRVRRFLLDGGRKDHFDDHRLAFGLRRDRLSPLRFPRMLHWFGPFYGGAPQAGKLAPTRTATVRQAVSHA